MAPGSVIVDMAAGQGGNVELSKPDEEVVVGGVTIDGPTNLPSTIPVHASMTYAKNLTAFLMNMYNGKERVLKVDTEDEIVRESLVARGGEVTNARVRQALGISEPVQPPPPAPAAPTGAPTESAAATTGKVS
jgi:NAD(P) transhydrogenase subunit alpha